MLVITVKSVSQEIIVGCSRGPSVDEQCLQNNVYEQSHNGSADDPGDWNRHKPGDEDVPEQTPVDRFPRAQPSYSHHGSHLCRRKSTCEYRFKLQTHFRLSFSVPPSFECRYLAVRCADRKPDVGCHNNCEC